MLRRARTLFSSGGPLAPRANPLLPGLYAWISTVIVPAAAARASTLAWVTASSAVLCLGAGVWLAPRRAELGRRLGVIGFVGLCLLTWLQLRDALGTMRLEPMRSALGAIAWALFAFGWGSVRPDVIPEDDPRAVLDDDLLPRRAVPSGAVAILGGALALGLVSVFLAWRIERSDHAMLGHAAAFAAIVALATSASEVAVGRGQRYSPQRPSRRLQQASGPLAGLVVLTVLGAFYRMGG